VLRFFPHSPLFNRVGRPYSEIIVLAILQLFLTIVPNNCNLSGMGRDGHLADAYAAAHLYYERGLTQEEVARRMEVSRPTVSKLLSLASQEGIVRISVRPPGQRDLGLQKALVDSLGLRSAVVLPGSAGSLDTREILLAQGTVELLKVSLPTLPKVEYMGLGWGRAMLAFVEAVEQRTENFLGGMAEVVPLIGGSGQSLDIFQINEIVRRTANALGTSARLLHAPALVNDERLRAALLAETSVRPVVEAWRKLDVAVVGIGRKLDPTSLADYLQEEPLQHESLVRWSVSDVCSHYFAADGKALGEEHDARLVAISRDELKRVPLTIGVAGGPEKVAGIVGAARAGLIKALVTDEDTANGCLEVTDVA
jgi:deoxyribonucleoside regulator